MRKVINAPIFFLTMILLIFLMLGTLFFSPNKYSILENRVLSTNVDFKINSIITNQTFSQINSFITDQLPFREQFILLNGLREELLLTQKRGNILIGKNRRMFDSSQFFDVKRISKNIQSLISFAEQTKLPITIVLIPPSFWVYQENIPSFYPSFNLQKLPINSFAKENVNILDAFPLLHEHRNSSSLYYYTDHHLTLFGAETILAEIGKLTNRSFNLKDGQLEKFDPFYGSFYQRAPSPLIHPDQLVFRNFDNMTLFVGKEKMPQMYDESLMKKNNKYSALLYNNPPLLSINNPNGVNSVLVIRDSQANALLPQLATAYNILYAIDPRYYQDTLFNFLTLHDVEEIICIYSYKTLSTDRNLLRLLDF